MVKITAVYDGNLRCVLTHEQSGTKIETDAPRDNHGKGARFAPSDLVGAAFAGSVLTTMALVARRDGVEIKGACAEVMKAMVSTPARRITALPLKVTLSMSIPMDYRAKLENAARTCPVRRTLHPDIRAEITFVYEP
jgi:uncharacterized OsmC-like protein